MMNNLRKDLRRICRVWVLLFAGISVKAQLVAMTWNPAGNPNQPSDDLWTTPGNRSGAAVPTAGHKAYFLNAGTAPCIVNGAAGGCQVSIGDGGPGRYSDRYQWRELSLPVTLRRATTISLRMDRNRL